MSIMESIKNFIGLSSKENKQTAGIISRRLEDDYVIAIVTVENSLSKSQGENDKASKTFWKYISWAGFSFYKAKGSYFKIGDKKNQVNWENFAIIYTPKERLEELKIFCKWICKKFEQIDQKECFIAASNSVGFFYDGTGNIEHIQNFNVNSFPNYFDSIGKKNFVLEALDNYYIGSMKLSRIEQITSMNIRKALSDSVSKNVEFTL